ncbi:MAG: Gfo/Idh/MocA family oxidoreductase [Anaerolineales bacterium]|jgi:predicted dehydrogenase
MDSVRWGLISTANINRRIIRAIRKSKRGILEAVASRNQSKADKYAQKWEIPRAYGSYQDMINSGKVDAVYISLPNHLHAEWSIKALQAGLHVLCEKPFALTLEEVDLMCRESHNNHLVLAEAFMYRHHPQTKIVGEWVRSGKLGKIMMVQSTFAFPITNKQDIRLVPEYGGGSLWDVGVYPISFAQFIYGGPPKWVFGSQMIGNSGVDEVFTGQMYYSSNQNNASSFAQISSSFRTPFYTRAEVIGTEGRLSLNRPFVSLEPAGKLIFEPRIGDPELIQVPQKDLYLGQIEDMHKAILDREQIYLSLEETRNHIKTVLALYDSAQKRKIINL